MTTRTGPQKERLFLMLDIETDGPESLKHNLRSIGLVGIPEFQQTPEPLQFYTTLQPAPDRQGHPATLAWWATRCQEQWRHLEQAERTHVEGLQALVDWLKPLTHRYHLHWIAMPASFDAPFLWCYLQQYLPDHGLPEKLLLHVECLSTLRNLFCLSRGLYGAQKAQAEQELSNHLPHPHHALEDAKQQMCMYWNLKRTLCAPPAPRLTQVPVASI